MVKGHLEVILAHWTCGLTTALMVGFNSLFSALQRKPWGYPTVEYITAMLYFVASKIILPCW
jgi:hypothetical protein